MIRKDSLSLAAPIPATSLVPATGFILATSLIPATRLAHKTLVTGFDFVKTGD